MSANHTPGPWHRNIKPGRKYPTELLEGLKASFEEHRRIDPHHHCDICKQSEKAIAKSEGRSLEHLQTVAQWDLYFLERYYPELVKAKGGAQ
ncbi:MAG TPA: hypothetical protein VHB45_13100 [Alloacidobacterium sp.]|nr:hypothetical protein [Alloacidobacterium sp.]